jgi:hypothetical protein
MRLLLAIATAVCLLAFALLLLLTPIWTHWAIAASGGTNIATTDQAAFDLSDRTVGELLAGPADFDFAGPDGGPIYSRDEAAHLRDARLVLYAFLGLAAAGALLLGTTLLRRPTDPSVWRAVGGGGAALAIVLAVVGAFAALAFGAAFELFHQLLFPGGNYAFDPTTSRLVALYPLGFWQLSAAALGVLGIGGGLAAWLIGRRRAARLEAGR